MDAAVATRPRTRTQARSMAMPGDPPSMFAWLCVTQLAVILAMIFV